MKGKPQTSYKMTLTSITGLEIGRFGGSLSKIVEHLGEHLYYKIDGQFDSYHTIRRELLRAGGAFSCYYPCVETGPVLLTIIEAKLVDILVYRTDEEIALANTPPAHIKKATLTVDCANCSTPVPVVDGRGHCPKCVDMFTEKPSPVTFPSHSHPTLTWDKMSKWQRKNYVIKS